VPDQPISDILIRQLKGETISTSLVDDNARLWKFKPTIRTLRISVRDAHLVRSWGTGQFREGSTDVGAVAVSVHGHAVLEKDSLALIAPATHAVKEATLSVRTTERLGSLSNMWANEAERARRLQSFEAGQEPDDLNLLQYLRNCYKDFESRPPSVAITFWPANWEFGNRDEWFIECEIPNASLVVLARDLERNRCSSVTISIELNPTLSDEWYAPPSVPVTLGVLSGAESSSGGSAYGWITNLDWQIIPNVSQTTVSRALAPEVSECLNAEPEVDKVTEVLGRIQLATLESLGELSRTTKRGFVFVLLLIGILALFR